MSRTWLFVFADDRELDATRIERERPDLVRSGRLKLLRTGVGKSRSAMATATYLASHLAGAGSRPIVTSIGTCAVIDPGLTWPADRILRPRWAVDRDATPELLMAVSLQPQPVLELEDYDDHEVTIGTGDGFVANEEAARALLARGIGAVDMETHSVAWAAVRQLAGPALSVRYVSDAANGTATRDWQRSASEARVALTEYVLRLTA